MGGGAIGAALVESFVCKGRGRRPEPQGAPDRIQHSEAAELWSVQGPMVAGRREANDATTVVAHLTREANDDD